MNEIFKGMDNAAEQINENFQHLDKEIIGNETEGYMELGNSLAICWTEGVPQSANYRETSSAGTFRTQTPAEWILPIEASGIIYTGVYVNNANRWGSARVNDEGSVEYFQHQGNANDILIPSRVFALVMLKE